jgi:hypothetical protein
MVFAALGEFKEICSSYEGNELLKSGLQNIIIGFLALVEMERQEYVNYHNF